MRWPMKKDGAVYNQSAMNAAQIVKSMVAVSRSGSPMLGLSGPTRRADAPEQLPAYNVKNVIRSSRLDERYDVAVFACAIERHGVLVVKDGAKVLLEEVVPLAYSAIFGPDVADVAVWQDRAITLVDQLGSTG